MYSYIIQNKYIQLRFSTTSKHNIYTYTGCRKIVSIQRPRSLFSRQCHIHHCDVIYLRFDLRFGLLRFGLLRFGLLRFGAKELCARRNGERRSAPPLPTILGAAPIKPKPVFNPAPTVLFTMFRPLGSIGRPLVAIMPM
jgi:hypothetical protein